MDNHTFQNIILLLSLTPLALLAVIVFLFIDRKKMKLQISELNEKVKLEKNSKKNLVKFYIGAKALLNDYGLVHTNSLNNNVKTNISIDYEVEIVDVSETQIKVRAIDFKGNDSFSRDPKMRQAILRFLQDIGIPKESLARGVNDIVGIGKQIVHNPQGLATPSAADASSVNMAAYKTARGSRDITPSDVDGNGVVNGKDVEDDVEDNVVGDEDGSAIDPSLMGQYSSLRRGMKMGSRHPDAITHDLYSSIDDEIDRRNRSAPSATRYDVADLQRMARLLGNQ
jgi:hypothetical protein